MANWNSEEQAREQIKEMVAEYYKDFKAKKEPFKEGDRITYAARVFDEKEMCALTDATLDFWLTTGRFSDEFEKKFVAHIELTAADLEALLPVISESYVEFESHDSRYDMEMNKKYAWWNAEMPLSTRFFQKMVQGTVVKTVNLYLRISPTATGKYELFASR